MHVWSRSSYREISRNFTPCCGLLRQWVFPNYGSSNKLERNFATQKNCVTIYSPVYMCVPNYLHLTGYNSTAGKQLLHDTLFSSHISSSTIHCSFCIQFIVRNCTVQDLFSLNVCTSFAFYTSLFAIFFSVKSAILSKRKGSRKGV